MVTETQFYYDAKLAQSARIKGRISGTNPLDALTKIVDELTGQHPEEVKLFTKRNVKNGVGMVAKYTNPRRATISTAPDGNWEWRNGDLYVDGILVPQQNPKYELVTD